MHSFLLIASAALTFWISLSNLPPSIPDTSGTHASECQEAGKPPIPNTPAGQRLKEFLQSFAGKDDALLRTFLRSFAASPQIKLTPEERFERMKNLRDDKAPFTLVDILDMRQDRITALLKDRNGEQVGLRLDLETSAEKKIMGLRLGDPESLKETPPLKMYADWKDLPQLLTQIQRDNGLPAMAVAVVQDGKVVDQAAVGSREQGKPEQVQIQERWHIGSIGKPMTSTLIAMLIEKGLLQWNRTLGEALPDVPMRPGYRNVTVEQLLLHRSGLPQEMNYTGNYVERITRGAKTPTEMRAAYIADLLQREPIAKPGARMAYSNGGYTLAGYLAERVTGKPYEQLMQEMVFRPLGMMTARVGGAGEPGQPQGHLQTKEGLRVFNFTGPLPAMTAPAGNITCSIGDLARFAAFDLEGLRGKGRLLKPETFQRLHTPPPVPAGQERYACGWEIVGEHTPQPFHGHGGSNGTFRAQLAIFPDQNLAIVAAQNSGGESDPSPPLQAILAIEKRRRK